ncbi:MAG: DUF1007 family protein [Halocynthiibacter sp.]
MIRVLFLISVLISPLPALAHPHIFIDTGLNFLFGQGRTLTDIEITWAYDEYYSLLILEERGLDKDGDGKLTPKEEKALGGFDANWDPDFKGDTYLYDGQKKLPLSRPKDARAVLKNGRIISTHRRSLAAPITPKDNISAKAFDPSYYVAYTISRGVKAKAKGCRAKLLQADLNAAYSLVEEMLYGPEAQSYTDDDYPAVGEAFSDTVILSCAP